MARLQRTFKQVCQRRSRSSLRLSKLCLAAWQKVCWQVPVF